MCDRALTVQQAQEIPANDWLRYYRDDVLK